MNTNENKLVMQSVCGKIHHPTMRGSGHYVGYDGIGRINVGVGGITYNYSIGDNCMDLAGDHVEPGVSLKNSNEGENLALNTLACIGNTAVIISGDAKGRIGYVTGKHGGVDHTILYFDKETLDLLCIDDRIQIKAYGQGMILEDYQDIKVMNLDPSLLKKMISKETQEHIEVPVAAILPAYLMGSGLGTTSTMNGDYDIMTQDKSAIEEYHLEQLRFGDIIAILDHDNSNGPHYKKGSITIGVIVHSDSFTSGHGPGVTVLMSGLSSRLIPIINKHANLADYLDIK